MSTDLVIGRQNSNIRQPDYSHFGPFASRTKGLSICADEFGEVLSFLGPEDLGNAEVVCRDWCKCIDWTDQWKRQCQNILESDPKKDLPEGLSYKKFFELISPRILSGSVYRRYIGEVGPVPRIPEAISLKKWNEPDPCNPTKTIGREYVWMYCPRYIETNLEGFSLDKPDDPDDLEAPKLIYREPIHREAELVEKCARKIELGAKSENKALRVPVIINNVVKLFKRSKKDFSLDKPDDLEVPNLIHKEADLLEKCARKIEFGTKSEALRVPVTINNIVELFKRPKTGNPSTCYVILDKILEQHGNKRIPAGWICMRKNVIGGNLSFAEQEALANEKRVIIPQLLHRILFNFLKQVRSRKANVYPDGRHPYIFAHTSTLIREDNGWYSSGCGGGDSSGLRVCCSSNHCVWEYIDRAHLGVCVALPVASYINRTDVVALPAAIEVIGPVFTFRLQYADYCDGPK